jgi:hypothetical protein
MPTGQLAALLANKTLYSPTWVDIEATYGTVAPTAPSAADAAAIATAEAEFAPLATTFGDASLSATATITAPLVAGGVAVVISANAEKAFGVIHDGDVCGGAPGAFNAVDNVLATITLTNCNEWKLSSQLESNANADVGQLANFAIGSQSCKDGYCGVITGGPVPEQPPFQQFYDYCVESDTAHAFGMAPIVTDTSPPDPSSNRWWGGADWQATPNMYSGCKTTVPGMAWYSLVPAGNLYDATSPAYTAWEAQSGATLVDGGTPIRMDVVRQYRCVVTLVDGETVEDLSPAGSEGSGTFKQPVCPGVSGNQVASRVQIYLTSPTASDGQTLIYDQSTTQEYQQWKTSFPECGNGSCLLDLRQNGASCFFQSIDCDGWINDSNRNSTYTCFYGVHQIVLSECYVYGPTLNAKNRATGHAYGDPVTGNPIEGQTSPSDVDALAASLLEDNWVTIGGFAPLSDEEKFEAARAVATSCLSQVGIALTGAQQVGELPIVNLKAADCSKRSIFAPGNDVSEATVHDGEAIQAGQASYLHYESAGDKNSGDNPLPHGWYNRVAYNNCGANYNPPATNCDEYPYYSTMEGGPGASLKNIKAGDNRKEGRLVRWFYAACGVTTATPDFVVAPILADTPDVEAGGSPSVGICVGP